MRRLARAAGTDGRLGYRVALTGRITKPDAVARVEVHEAQGHYCTTLGPDGKWQLPESPTA